MFPYTSFTPDLSPTSLASTFGISVFAAVAGVLVGAAFFGFSALNALIVFVVCVYVGGAVTSLFGFTGVLYLFNGLPVMFQNALLTLGMSASLVTGIYLITTVLFAIVFFTFLAELTSGRVIG
jgi:hypothetical protein